jgi:hypothetical protein
VLQGGADGKDAVHAHPDDKTDDMAVSVQYASHVGGGGCPDRNDTASWSSTLPPGGAAGCIKISGFGLPANHKAHIDIKFTFNPDGTDWPTSKNPQTAFRAGFNFKLNKYYTYNYQQPSEKTYTATDNVVTVGTGKKVTAIGGFAFIGTAPANGDIVRIFQTQAAAGVSSTNPYGVCSGGYASTTVDPDGFYFITKQGTVQDDTATMPAIASGTQYFVQLCTGTTPVAVRTIDHKLGNQEFDEEDFNDGVQPWPASLSFNRQDNTPSNGDQIKVIYSEPLAEASMCSTWGTDNTKDQTLQPAGTPVTVAIGNGGSGNDTLSITSVSGACGGTFHFGSINLGTSGYIASGYVNFTQSKIQWNHNGQLTITLGGTPTGLSPVSGTPTATYTPDASMTDPTGNTIMGTAMDTNNHF